jgi:hypothetical protein
MTGKERVINTDTVLCIALMTLSGIPAENGIQGMVDQYFSAYSVFDY